MASVSKRLAGAVLRGLDQTAVRVPPVVRDILLGPVLYAAMLGSGLWALKHPQQLKELDTNKLSEADSNHVLVYVAVAFAGFLGLVAALGIYRRIVSGEARFGAAQTTVTRFFFPVLGLPLVALLNLPGIEHDSPKLTLLFVCLAALLAARGIYRFPEGVEPAALDDPRDGARSPLRAFAERWGAAFAVTTLVVGYGLVFSRLSITNHHGLATRTTDLGYYDNILFQSIHGKPLGCSLTRGGTHSSAHFDPILILLSPLYLLYPRAEFLLVLQSFWLGSGVVPVYLLARAKLGNRGAGLALGAVYALYPALHGANLYEFHSLALITPIVLWMLYFLETGAHRAYLALLLPALLCREDVSLLLCFVGLYAIADRRPSLVRLGWMTIAASCLYFVVVKRWFMLSPDVFNSGSHSYSYAYYYEDLIPHGHGMRDLAVSLVTNPAFVLQHVFSEAKIIYFFLLFAPLAFLPLLAKPGRVMLVYGLAFCMLASRTAVFSVHFQYSCVIIPIAFALAPAALKQLEDGAFAASLGADRARLSRAVLTACVVAGALVSWKFGAILENQSFRGGFGHVVRRLTDDQKATYAWIDDAVGKLPRGASLGVTNLTGAHASNRMAVTFYPTGPTPDYLFIDEGELRGGDLDRHHKTLAHGDLVEVSRHGQLVVYRKKAAPPGAAASAVPAAATAVNPAGAPALPLLVPAHPAQAVQAPAAPPPDDREDEAP